MADRLLDDDLLVVGQQASSLELRSWSELKLAQRVKLPATWESWEVISVARRGLIAAADTAGTIFLFFLDAGKVARLACAPHRVRALRFSDDGTSLAALLDHRSAGCVRVWRIGQTRPYLYMDNLDRRGIASPAKALVGVVGSLDFDETGEFLHVGVTCLGAEAHRWTGWRAHLCVYDLVDGRLRWSAEVDAEVTGDLRGVRELEPGEGLPGPTLLVEGDQLVSAGLAGAVTWLDARDGAARGFSAYGSALAITAIARAHDGGLWALDERGHLFELGELKGGSRAS